VSTFRYYEFYTIAESPIASSDCISTLIQCISSILEQHSFIVFFQAAACCGYGTNGAAAIGFDCAIIPGASQNTADSNMFPGGEFCGNSNLAANNAAVTVCCK